MLQHFNWSLFFCYWHCSSLFQETKLILFSVSFFFFLASKVFVLYRESQLVLEALYMQHNHLCQCTVPVEWSILTFIVYFYLKKKVNMGYDRNIQNKLYSWSLWVQTRFLTIVPNLRVKVWLILCCLVHFSCGKI